MQGDEGALAVPIQPRCASGLGRGRQGQWDVGLATSLPWPRATHPEVPTPRNDFSHGETRLTREGRRRLRGDTGRCCNQYQRTGTGTDKLRLPRLECTACQSLKVSTAQTPSH